MSNCNPESAIGWSIGSTAYFVAYLSILFGLSVYAAITVSKRSKKCPKVNHASSSSMKDITTEFARNVTIRGDEKNGDNKTTLAVGNGTKIETQNVNDERQAPRWQSTLSVAISTKQNAQNKKNEVALSQRVEYSTCTYIVYKPQFEFDCSQCTIRRVHENIQQTNILQTYYIVVHCRRRKICIRFRKFGDKYL